MNFGHTKRIFLVALIFILGIAICACDGDDITDIIDVGDIQSQLSTTAEGTTKEETTDGEHTHIGGKATCSEKAVCEICGEKYGELAEHPAAEEYEKNETHHWHSVTCSHVDEKIGYKAHTFTSHVTQPTCTEQGYTTYTCVCGYSYKDNYTSATGHSFDTQYQYNDAKHWHKSTCEHLNETSGEDTHNFISQVTQPNCTEQGYTTYTCVCGYSYVSDYTDPTGHNVLEWTKKETNLTNASCCEYTVVYEGVCQKCSKTQKKTETIERHSFYWSISEVATCQNDGQRVKLCSSEQCEYHTHSAAQETYSDPNNHTWTVSGTEGSVVMYACDCGATKSVIESTGNSAEVSGSVVASTDEVRISDIVIGFDDDIRERLSESDTVTIGADALDGDDKQNAISELNLSAEQLEKLGDNTVYDFTLNDGDNVSLLGGKATVKIPYSLADGENPENIIVWYISNGTLTSIKARYENGYAVFETDHFSYYTVTKITDEERCKYYGHSQTEIKTVAPTCTQEGYVLCLCCGEISETIEANGHSWYETVVKDASCEEKGIKKYTCSSCKSSYEEIIAATGHSVSDKWVTTEKIHAHKCETCETLVDSAEHEWDYEEATEEHGITCTVCGYVREEKKPSENDTKKENHIKVEVTVNSDGASLVKVNLFNANFSGIRMTVAYGREKLSLIEGADSAIYKDVGGRINYTLVSQDNFTVDEMILLSFTVEGRINELNLEILEIYVFTEKYDINVPNCYVDIA